ncbi:ribonuclease H family protein (plasmid) [Aneurinibacillus sp. Ricciae_BoGa-3]|uniref:ribonuclease H family protein n=1 Tax=Aneurinibacillus sp. Ricciae_BoGa-3 TaxID=3022697 RepID=UPI00233FFB01|nr:ribonuclease H family protein [Aneurinibacillus sp. Ricciae_BoGa-3]WCK57300.1 ribonuclease H family protein [Aneurinibacillus sp. Ricciae_BoGa-3]
MAKKNFYAIKKGLNPISKEIVENLILTTWDEAKSYVQGINEKKHGVTPDYKGFFTREEAESYLQADEPFLRKADATFPIDCLHCYVDGSFNSDIKNYSYGLVCVLGGKIVHTDKGVGRNKQAISMQQIGGELLGAMNALLFAKKNGYKKLVLFFDYKGVCLHATGFWKRDNQFSEDYYQWMQKFFEENSNIEVIFCKVDAHTGDDFNEIADSLAKMALGIKPDAIFHRMVEKYNLSI